MKLKYFQTQFILDLNINMKFPLLSLYIPLQKVKNSEFLSKFFQNSKIQLLFPSLKILNFSTLRIELY